MGIRNTASNRHCPVSAEIYARLEAIAREESRAGAIEELADEYEADPAKRTEAADWIDGTLDGDDYKALNRWMCEFGTIDRAAVFAAERTPHVDAVIDQLHMMAGRFAALMRARLEEMAADALSLEDAP